MTPRNQSLSTGAPLLIEHLPRLERDTRTSVHAQRAAHRLTGCSISNVERLDDVAA